MKNTKIQEIENFVNGLEQSYLSEHQMMTLAVNPEEVVGGINNNGFCENSSCDHSRNRKWCVNQSDCNTTINRKECDNQKSDIGNSISL